MPSTPHDDAGAATALNVSGLRVAYGSGDGRQKTVVWDVDLALTRGEILGLAGESGCGKSTVALASIGYAGQSRILGGKSELGAVDLLKLPIRDLRSIWGRRVAYVAQDPSQALNPALTIGRQLEQPLKRHLGLRGAVLRARQAQLLEDVGIPSETMNRYPHQFSGGQQQRIAIAIALSCQPEVLVLDEPTTGLDVTTQARIVALIRTIISDSGTAALFVSHDLSLLATIAERVAIMYAGEIVEEGAADAVIRQPRHPYTHALLEAVPSARAPRPITGIPGRPPAQVRLDVCAFAGRCRYAAKVCEQRIPLLAVGERKVRCVRTSEIDLSFPKPKARGQRDAMSGQPLLEVANVSCTYRHASAPAVDDVSFSLASGEVLGIAGESGSGKTTLLRTIVGLQPSQAGVIRLLGAELSPDVRTRPRSVAGDLQLVFQNPASSLNPRQTVGQILRRPLRLFRDDVPRGQEMGVVKELLEAVQLPAAAVLHQYPTQLSGGQRQRVALARAFAAQPALLLCDEVTSSLDVSVQATILNLVADLAARFSSAVLFVTHDLGVVRAIADRVLIMNGGQICEQGSTDEVFTNPQHPYTRVLLESIPDAHAIASRYDAPIPAPLP